MSIWPKDFSLERDGVTHSLLAAASVCPVRAALMADRWYAPGKVRSTTFGSTCHEVIHALYSIGLKDRKLVVDRAIEGYYKKNREELDEILGAEEWERIAAKVYDVMVAYAEYYHKDFRDAKFTALEGLAESRFDAWLLRGRLDGVFTAKDGSRWLLETKTMSRIDEESLWLRVSFDTQVQFYLGMYELATGERLNGALYNVIRNPSHKTRARWQDGLQANPEHFFMRSEVRFTKADRERFRNDLEAQLQELDMRVNGLLPTWRNTATCDKPYKCDFLNWCATGSTEGLRQHATLYPELQD